MTKEELKQEAEEKCVCTDESMRIMYGIGFIDGAEPREKRIEKLEKKLEQTEKDLADYQFNYPKIKELEKENAELKEKLKPENCLKLLAKEGYIKFTSEQLPKATEIIKGLYFIIQSRIDYANNTGIADEMWRAEQFLKEIEK